MGHTRKPARGKRSNTTRSSRGIGRSKKGESSKTAKRPQKSPKKATNIAQTAFGAEPEKRSLKGALFDSAQKSRHEASIRVKTAKGRKLSSTLWLQRQLNDPYVARAKADGYRSRAAYKLLEIHEKAALLRQGDKVVDLGAAPGGWCQVAVRKTGALSARSKAQVIGIDYLGMPPVDGAAVLEFDFLDPAAPVQLKAMLNGRANVVLSDMAAPTTGHRATDHLKIIALAESALDFAEDVLAVKGHFVAKVFQGGTQHELLGRLKKRFDNVLHIKPKASRQQSPETYVVALGYRGGGKVS